MKSVGWRRKPTSVTTMEQHRPPLLIRIIGIAVMLGLAALLVIWGIDLGKRLIGAGSTDAPAEGAAASAPKAFAFELGKVNVEMKAERERLIGAQRTAESALQTSASQIKALQLENSKLAGDLALAESLLPLARSGSGLNVLGLQAEMVAPGQLHYVMLLSYGEKDGRSAFNGRVQLALTLVQDGKPQVVLFPDDQHADAPEYALAVKRYQRFDGVLEVPEGASAKSLQIRLLEKGQPVTRLSTSVKDGHGFQAAGGNG